MNEANLRLFMAVFAVLGIVYVWAGSGMMSKGNREWWSELPQGKRIIFVLAITATLLQMFM